MIAQGNLLDASEDGRFILDTHEIEESAGEHGLYLLDTLSGQSKLIAAVFSDARISSDGTTVVYSTTQNADALGDPNDHADIFRYSVRTEESTAVTFGQGWSLNAAASDFAVDATGDRIVFYSTATTDGSDPGSAPLKLWSTNLANPIPVAIDISGIIQSIEQVDLSSGAPSLSDDGRWVMFGGGLNQLDDFPASPFPNELPEPAKPNLEMGVLLTDLTKGTTQFLSLETRATGSIGEPPIHFTTAPTISGNGRVVAFVTPDTNTVNGLAPHFEAVALDRATGRVLTSGEGPLFAPSDIGSLDLDLSRNGGLMSVAGFYRGAKSPTEQFGEIVDTRSGQVLSIVDQANAGIKLLDNGASSLIATITRLGEPGTIHLIQGNHAPKAVADKVQILSSSDQITIDVLANDKDKDAGDGKEIVRIAADSIQGSVSALNEKLLYDTDGAFDALAKGKKAVEVFSYTMRDDAGALATATVKVTVKGVGATARQTLAADEAPVEAPAEAKSALKLDEILGDQGAGQDHSPPAAHRWTGVPVSTLVIE